MASITPRWLTRALQWVPVEAGVFRRNRVREGFIISVGHAARDEGDVPKTFVDIEDTPREYLLESVNSVVDIHTRVAHLYSAPYSQVSEQLRLTIETMKEKQEYELVNNPGYGLLANVEGGYRIKTRAGAPTPDDLDELLSVVWKEPGFFLANPAAIAAFGRECTRRGVPPPTVSMFGAQFVTWRGVPLIPSDKVPVVGNKTSILLIRTGQARQGVIGLYQPNLPGEQGPGLSVRFNGINQKAIASYLVSLYYSLAVLTVDAVGVLEGVEIDRYHTYSYPGDPAPDAKTPAADSKKK